MGVSTVGMSADPAEEALAADARRDHGQAARRGERLLMLADSLVSGLVASGVTIDRESARVTLFHILADDIYGNAAIDVPTLRGGQ